MSLLAAPEFLQHLRRRIQIVGPLSVADYMRESLTNPIAGYYMHRDVFGQHGDFTTAPEVSQIYGELVGVWLVSQWLHAHKPQSIRLVELGPGRGTLMTDILRATRAFPDFQKALHVSLVEISPKLSEMQYGALVQKEETTRDIDMAQAPYRSARAHTSTWSCTMDWFSRLEDVPDDCFTMIVAHEFFDALPIHQFQFTSNGWRERLIDLSGAGAQHPFRYALAPAKTGAQQIAARLSLLPEASKINDCIEVSLDSMRLYRQIGNRLRGVHGGTALILDYGSTELYSDTFRAFRKHQQVHVFDQPGTSDLTADVNFMHVRRGLGQGVMCRGPVTQKAFLEEMGIEARVEVLLKQANHTQAHSIRSGVEKLTDAKQMGTSHKAFAAAVFPNASS